MDTREETTRRPPDAPASASQPPPQRQAGALKRVLLVANETVAAPGVRERIKELVGGESAEVFVVAPALTRSRFEQFAGDVDEAIEEAKKRLEASVRALRESGIPTSGVVGDSDPNLALEDALRRFPADTIVIATHPPGRSRWLERDVVEKAREVVDVPVIHVVVDVDGGEAEVKQIERLPPARPDDPQEPVTAYDLPPLRPIDWAGIVAGVVGTVVLGILAIICSGDISEEGMSAGCAIRIGIAIAVFAMTVFHVLALLFFGAVRYRGRWANFAAYTLLAAVPAAVLISALVE